jgi:hypothetical protein
MPYYMGRDSMKMLQMNCGNRQQMETSMHNKSKLIKFVEPFKQDKIFLEEDWHKLMSKSNLLKDKNSMLSIQVPKEILFNYRKSIKI